MITNRITVKQLQSANTDNIHLLPNSKFDNFIIIDQFTLMSVLRCKIFRYHFAVHV